MQILKTAQYLRGQGHSVTLDSAAPGVKAFDLIHFWGLSPMETLYPVFSHAARAGRPIVLTAIYWDLERYYEAMGSAQRLRLWKEQRPLRREMAAESARVFVSGQREAETLAQDVGIPVSCAVVPCGIDASLFGSTPDVSGERRGVLCAARIGPRKNQIELARQCAVRCIPLTLVGPVGNEPYLHRCLEFSHVQYVGAVSSRRLAEIYRKARIHALAGYAETPGLASLEAAACGCEILTTGEGTAGEYFGAAASYCDPYVPGSVGVALDRALETAYQPQLREAVLKQFSWENCLRPLLGVYQELA